MPTLGTILISLGTILFVIGFLTFCSYIKSAYRKYDEEETIKEEIENLKKSIKNALIYFHDTYNNDFDHTVYENIRIKVDFLKGLIDKFSENGTKRDYYKKLYERLYETGYRLKTRFDDVAYVLAPMNSLRDELIREKLEYLKENYDV